MRTLIARLTLVCALGFAVTPSCAAESPRGDYGFSIGGGAGAARVEGARLEFGRDRVAVAMALHGGRVLSPRWRLGLHLDAVGAGSGKVVALGVGYPTSPMTTTHRVAVNHLSLTTTWRPAAGAFFARAGAGLAESFTEDWDSDARPVHRSFGPGAVAGLGVAPRVGGGQRVAVALDGVLGSYAGRRSWAAMLTVGIETP